MLLPLSWRQRLAHGNRARAHSGSVQGWELDAQLRPGCQGLLESILSATLEPAVLVPHLLNFYMFLLQFVFGTCAAGAVVLTVNVVLLGGNIGFFQSMCLLGYCLFPMDVAAIVTACTTNMIARWIVVLVSSYPVVPHGTSSS